MNKVVLAFLLLLSFVVLFLVLCTVQIERLGYWQYLVPANSSPLVRYKACLYFVFKLLSLGRFWIPFVQTPNIAA